MRAKFPKTTAGHLAENIGGRIEGDPQASVCGVALMHEAQPGDLVFVGNEKYLAQWKDSPAEVAMVAEPVAAKARERSGCTLLIVDNIDFALAKLLEHFPAPEIVAGLGPVAAGNSPSVHPSAVVDPTAELGPRARIGAFCVVGPRVKIGRGTTLLAGVSVFDDASVGSECTLWNGVVVRENCRIGDRCILHANVVIGADGFGYRPAPGGTVVKIPHVGDVVLGNDVEIGANTCVDRGKLSSTVIGDFCKIDNLCQIGHNTRLGRGVIIAGLTGISGSVTIGSGVLIGGGAGIADHVTVGDGAQISAAAGVMRDVPPNTRVAGLPARHIQQCFREQAALTRLPDWMRRMKK